MSLPPHILSDRASVRRPARRWDWPGYRHALLRTLYALLMFLLMLWPANFIAYAISYSTNGGSAIQGLSYAIGHHFAGYYVAAGGHASAVGAATWWASVVWEALFWLSCASAVVLLVLWSVRVVLARLARDAQARRVPTPARAA